MQLLFISWQAEQEKLASQRKGDEDKKDKDYRERAQSKSPRRLDHFCSTIHNLKLILFLK